jgi:hypothetical protein
MTRVRRILGRAARPTARVMRLLVRPLLFVAGLHVGAGLVGQWVTAAVAGPLVLGWVLARWAAVERRLDQRARTAGPVVVGPRGPRRDGAGEHVAFARALVAVSARYLAHCQDQADEQRAGARREVWR